MVNRAENELLTRVEGDAPLGRLMREAMERLKAEGFGFATEWMRKDMGICLDQARKSGARLPVAALVDQFWSHLEARGGKRWDSTAGLVQLLLKD